MACLRPISGGWWGRVSGQLSMGVTGVVDAMSELYMHYSTYSL